LAGGEEIDSEKDGRGLGGGGCDEEPSARKERAWEDFDACKEGVPRGRKKGGQS